MTVRLTIHTLDPLPSVQQYRVPLSRAKADWSDAERERRTCFWCHSTYRWAGYAWRCEHWHEVAPT